jgi:hypothetical protein
MAGMFFPISPIPPRGLIRRPVFCSFGERLLLSATFPACLFLAVAITN